MVMVGHETRLYSERLSLEIRVISYANLIMIKSKMTMPDGHPCLFLPIQNFRSHPSELLGVGRVTEVLIQRQLEWERKACRHDNKICCHKYSRMSILSKQGMEPDWINRK